MHDIYNKIVLNISQLFYSLDYYFIQFDSIYNNELELQRDYIIFLCTFDSLKYILYHVSVLNLVISISKNA